jgi:transposase
MLFESQSSPSYNPSPEVAHVLWMYLQNINSDHISVFECVSVCMVEWNGEKGMFIDFTNGVAGENGGRAYQ